MDSIDLARLSREARSRYERARLGLSVAGAAPVLFVVAAAAVLGKRPSSVAFFGGLLFVTGVVLLWRGRDLRLALWPGVLTGLIPLAFALIANFGHGCSGDHCSSLCVPACTAGGVTAGVVVSVIATRLKLGWRFWLSASAVSMLTGAMGCACVGYSGVLALVGGFAVGLTPQVARRVFASR
ncbi:MAG: hypothetical protein DI536_31725 [Archangium gephyra]|jgi:hypothetical protein|uniref:Uncharacterized protein n=1 Tax=Archangium gephyra TaxID=48 RepID=A0A2W5SRY0_9BACT|nr:MAG: hypothetical protein DI536_31725 [Archangium gephyra]